MPLMASCKISYSMFDCVCLLEVLELSFSSLNPLPWANEVSVMNFLSSQTRGASRKERRN